MKIVVVSPRFPYPLEKGDKLRLYHQLKVLSDHYEIVLISLTDIDVDPNHKKHLETFISKVHIFKLSKAKILFRLLKGVFSKKPFQVLYFFNPFLKSKIDEIIHDVNPNFIFNQLIRTTEYTKDLDYVKVLDYMDSFSNGMKKRLNNSRFPFRYIYKLEYSRLKNYETNIFNDFKKHGIISDQDRLTFSSKISDKITVIPNGVDMDFFKPINAIKKYHISFVGNMGYRPNVIASEFLVNNILPLLNSYDKNVNTLLAGARPSYRVKILESNNVKVSGWVDDIRTAYAEAEIFVAPIFTGIGQQNKILEAMAMGIPVITTTSVNKAIGAKQDTEIIIANNAKEFSDKIQMLLDDPKYASQIGDSGRLYVKNNYSWTFQGEKLLNMFQK